MANLVNAIWVLYRGKILISNCIFVKEGTILPFEQGTVKIIAGALGYSEIPVEELAPLDLSVQGERLPQNLLFATQNLKKHLKVLKETGRARFMFHLDGSLSVSVEESLRCAA